MKLSYLEEYVKLAETLNFSKTAELMYITQPALSRHIAVIESEIGAKLFLRDTRHVVLTDAGKVAHKCFASMLTEFYTSQNLINLLSSDESGCIIISSPYYYTSDFTEPIVEHFSFEHPHCNVQILSCQPVDGYNYMCNGNSDLLISTNIGSSSDQDICQIPFATEKLAVLLSSTHLLSNHTSINPTELINDTFIFLDDNSGYRTYNEEIRSIFTRLNIPIQKSIFTQQVDTLGLTIQKTGGISIMPFSVRHMDRTYIKAIPLDGNEYNVKMCLSYRNDNHNPMIQKFIGTAINIFSNNNCK